MKELELDRNEGGGRPAEPARKLWLAPVLMVFSVEDVTMKLDSTPECVCATNS